MWQEGTWCRDLEEDKRVWAPSPGQCSRITQDQPVPVKEVIVGLRLQPCLGLSTVTVGASQWRSSLLEWQPLSLQSASLYQLLAGPGPLPSTVLRLTTKICPLPPWDPLREREGPPHSTTSAWGHPGLTVQPGRGGGLSVLGPLGLPYWAEFTSVQTRPLPPCLHRGGVWGAPHLATPACSWDSQ